MTAPASPYDDSNIFAKILRGEIPAAKVFEDDVAIAFMDVMPQGEGHTLVVPKAKARTLLDISPDDLAALILRVQKVAKAVKTAFEADGLTLFQFSEPAGGQTVFHLHFHVVPRFDGIELCRHEGGMAACQPSSDAPGQSVHASAESEDGAFGPPNMLLGGSQSSSAVGRPDEPSEPEQAVSDSPMDVDPSPSRVRSAHSDATRELANSTPGGRVVPMSPTVTQMVKTHGNEQVL